MFQIPEQISAAGQAQVKLAEAVTGKALDSTEQLLALQLSTGQAILARRTAAARELLAARDPRELFIVGASLAGPAIEQLIAYSRQLYTIASGLQHDGLAAARETVGALSAPRAATAPIAPAEVAEVTALARRDAADPVDADTALSEAGAGALAAPTVLAQDHDQLSVDEVVAKAAGKLSDSTPHLPPAAAALDAPSPLHQPAPPAVDATATSAPGGKPVSGKAIAANSEPKRRDTLNVKLGAKVRKK